MTHAEIGKILGYSDEYIRKIELKALKKLAKNKECKRMMSELRGLPDVCGLWEAIQNQTDCINVRRKYPR